MDWFALVSFIIAVIGIILQLVDAFPDHRETRKAVVVMALGVFVGVGISTLLNTKFSVTGNFDARYGLLYGIAAITTLFGLLAALLGNSEKRDIAGVAAGVGVLLFVASGLAVGISWTERVPYLSKDELIALASHAERQGAYEKAIERLMELDAVTREQATSDRIKAKIDSLRKLQDETLPLGNAL
jgi:hypothetical protein